MGERKAPTPARMNQVKPAPPPAPQRRIDLRSGKPTWDELDRMYTDAIRLVATLRAQLTAAGQEIDTFWTEVQRSYDIEDRAFFEKEAKPIGFASPLAMAVHHMWKRDVKDRDGMTIIGAAQHAKLVAEIARLKGEISNG